MRRNCLTQHHRLQETAWSETPRYNTVLSLPFKCLQCTVKFTVFLFHLSVYSLQCTVKLQFTVYSLLKFTQLTILQYNVYNTTQSIYNCNLQLYNLQPNTRWKFYDLWHGLMELVWQMSHILITSKSQISDLPSARWYGNLCRNTSHKPTGGKEWMMLVSIT